MTREELFNNLKAGARWDVGVSINRSNSLPLDANSIFESYAAAAAYASKDATRIAEYGFLNNAYIGQIIAVIENKTVGEETVTTVGLYYIDAELKLQPVGKEVIADEKTIINDNGTIKLYGFEAAAAATYPRKKADGTLEWVTVQELVEGATENTITVGDGTSIINESTDTGYKLSVNGYVAATEGQVPSKTATGFNWIDVYTKSEIDAKVSGVLSYKGVAAGAPTDGGANIVVGDTTISASSANIGHVYAYQGREYVSNGLIWEELGDSTDLSAYYTKTETDAAIAAAVKIETDRAMEAEEELGDRIAVLEAIDHTKYAIKTEVEASLKTLGEKDTALEGQISTINAALGSATTTGALKDIADLKTLTSGHSTTLETLRTDVDGKVAQGTYDAYVADRQKTDTQIAEDITGAVTPVSNRVTALETTVGSDTTGLVGKVATLEATVSDYATIKSNVSTNTIDIAQLKTDINGTVEKPETGLKSKVASLESNYGAINGNVTTLTNQMAGIGTDETVKGLITAVDTKVSGNTSAININAGNITDLDTRLTALDAATTGKVPVLEGKVATLEGQITGLTGAMHFRGVSTTDPTLAAGPTLTGVTNPVWANGDVVIYGTKEYVYSNSTWVLLGDEGSYAIKATTLEGYGITNAYTKTEVDEKAATAEANAKAYVDEALTWVDMATLEG